MMKRCIRSLLIFLTITGLTGCAQTEESQTLVYSGRNLPVICIAQDEDPLLQWAVSELAGDLEKVTGSRPEIIHQMPQEDEPGIIIGRNGHPFAEDYTNGVSADSNRLDIYGAAITGDSVEFEQNLNTAAVIPELWENYMIRPHGSHLLVYGSDIRGTVYGIFELSERLGVSPWYWWADVTPLKKKRVKLQLPVQGISGSPSVQYRGIFLNDEDWGLQPWAAKNFEKEVGDIGPKTYEKIFQLLLRLKANTIWPAMHPSTQPFFTIPGNKEMAGKYHIVIGTSHAEPMLRNNVREWDRKEQGPFNYFTNSSEIERYWEQRITEVNDSSSQFIVTMGLRGEHDSRMQGGTNDQERMEILEKVIVRQREILQEILQENPLEIPQVFIPYKEVLYLYDRGLYLPEDISIVWTDDNYGYIRRRSSAEEQERKGGSGIYYHLSYWGRPHDYLWLSTTQPGLIWYEMTRAWQNGARKMWIANVGDIKPAEYTMEFFLDLAWDIHSVNERTIKDHLAEWAAREFGIKTSGEIADLMQNYYRLAFLRKPEYMGWSRTEPTTGTRPSAFSPIVNKELDRRISAYKELEVSCSAIKRFIPSEKHDAFFQLVEYPVRGAANMNYKYLFYQRAMQRKSIASRERDLQKSKNAYEEIRDLTRIYNEEISGGKWNHMMHAAPRGLPVFKMPDYSMENAAANDSIRSLTSHLALPVFKRVADFNRCQGSGGYAWTEIEGLGYSDASVTLLPAKQMVFNQPLPYIEYAVDFPQAGRYEIEVRVLPTHSNSFDHEVILRMDGADPGHFMINTRGRSEQWKVNVLRNYTAVRYEVDIDLPGKHTFQIAVNQTGIVLDQIAVHPVAYPAYYEIPW